LENLENELLKSDFEKKKIKEEFNQELEKKDTELEKVLSFDFKELKSNFLDSASGGSTPKNIKEALDMLKTKVSDIFLEIKIFC